MLRGCGYKRDIHSFEPVNAAFTKLRERAEQDRTWHVYQCALGSQSGVKQINISANLPSSSFLQLEERNSQELPVDITMTRTEQVEVQTLDIALATKLPSYRSVFLKVDTQGYESEVLAGAEDTLRKCRLVQLELSLVSIYQGEMLCEAVMALMRGVGFMPWWVAPGFRNSRTLQMYQIDVLFARPDVPGVTAVGAARRAGCGAT
jgi:FkbM family methyltransferase